MSRSQTRVEFRVRGQRFRTVADPDGIRLYQWAELSSGWRLVVAHVFGSRAEARAYAKRVAS